MPRSARSAAESSPPWWRWTSPASKRSENFAAFSAARHFSRTSSSVGPARTAVSVWPLPLALAVVEAASRSSVCRRYPTNRSRASWFFSLLLLSTNYPPCYREEAILAIGFDARGLLLFLRALLERPLEDDVHACARWRRLDVAVSERVDDLLRPLGDVSGPGVAAVIEIHADVGVGATEHESNSVVGRLAGFVGCKGLLEGCPRHEVRGRSPALGARRIEHLRHLALAHLHAPAHPLGAFSKLLGDVLGRWGV